MHYEQLPRTLRQIFLVMSERDRTRMAHRAIDGHFTARLSINGVELDAIKIFGAMDNFIDEIIEDRIQWDREDRDGTDNYKD